MGQKGKGHGHQTVRCSACQSADNYHVSIWARHDPNGLGFICEQPRQRFLGKSKKIYSVFKSVKCCRGKVKRRKWGAGGGAERY